MQKSMDFALRTLPGRVGKVYNPHGYEWSPAGSVVLPWHCCQPLCHLPLSVGLTAGSGQTHASFLHDGRALAHGHAGCCGASRPGALVPGGPRLGPECGRPAPAKRLAQPRVPPVSTGVVPLLAVIFLRGCQLLGFPL